jgi:hypothetical protein
MADGIIDIRQYLDSGDEDENRGAFSLWGADGERSRFALPLWRVIYLAGGDRGAIASASAAASQALEPLVVLDLLTEPARLDLSTFPLSLVDGDQGPMLTDLVGRGLAVLLGESVGRRWYLLVDGRGEATEPLEPSTKEDILFLSGECAGLLFFRDLAGLEGGPSFEEE